MKQCRKCGEEKPLTEYYKRKASKDGYANWCKSCSYEYNKKWEKTPKGKLTHKLNSKKAYYKVKDTLKFKNRINNYKANNKDKKAILVNKWRNSWGSGVYGVFSNGECLYIGESTKLKCRINSHKSYSTHIAECLKQHDCWFIGILEQCDNHKEREQYYIDMYSPIYNI